MTREQTKELHQIFLEHPNICRDNRKVESGDIFISIKGENFDGNQFAQDAIDKGAFIAIVDDPKLKGKKIFKVADSVKALQELANFHRNYLGLPIIAITGSNGKTTTKELLDAVLSQKYNTLATHKNLNNHIGVPLTLLQMHEETDLGIVEMGTNHFGEIESLCQIAEPDFGYITGIGKAHLEFFGDLKGVIREKSALFDFIKAKKGKVFVNLDDKILREIAFEIDQDSFSFDGLSAATIQLKDISSENELKIRLNNIEIQTKLIGKYNLANLGAAILIGKFFNISDAEIKTALETYTPKDMRSQIVKKNGNKIILDTYNANPTSMMAALKNVLNMQNGNTVVILGDMFELGDHADKEHQNIVNFIQQHRLQAYLIGEHFLKTHSKDIEKFATLQDFLKQNTFQNIKNALILIKGSRSMQLEKILE